jgi:AcrR family transcriptional regulator
MRSKQPNTSTSSSRDRLLAAAKRLFAAQGYEQTATSAIARQAGTSESQLMRYFGGKVGLLEALFDEAWRNLNARVDRAIPAGASNRDSLLAAIQTVVNTLARDPALATLFMFEGRRRRGDEPRVRVSRGYTAFAETIQAFVKKAQAGRELNPRLNTAAVTSALLGATESMLRDRILARAAGTRAYPEREVRRTLEAILTGLSGATLPSRQASAAGRKR